MGSPAKNASRYCGFPRPLADMTLNHELRLKPVRGATSFLDGGQGHTAPLHHATHSPFYTFRPDSPLFRTMVLILIPLAFIALLYGFWRLYLWLSVMVNPAVGVLVVAVLAAMLIGACIQAWRRYRSLHGRTVNGRRVLVLEGPWGRLAVNALDKRGNLTLDGQHVDFIFSDIASATLSTGDQTPTLTLKLKNSTASDWSIPMPDRREASRWQRIFALAQERRL